MIEHMSQNMTKTSKKALFQPYNEVKISNFQDIQNRRGNRLPKSAVGFAGDVQAISRIRLCDLSRTV